MRATLMKKLRSFRRNEDGVTLVEYGIALTLAVVVGATALSNLANNVDGEMTDACTVMNGTGTTNSGC